MADNGMKLFNFFLVFLIACTVPLWYGVQSFWEAGILTKLLCIFGVTGFYCVPLLLYLGRFAFIILKYRVFNLLPDPSQVLKEHVFSGFVSPTDLDHFLHMNNARYLRELDFARTAYYGDSGLILYLQSSGVRLIMSACVVRYRKSLQPFQRFRVTTKITYWDDDSFYFQHSFLSRFKTHPDFVYATILTKMHCSNQTPSEILCGMLSLDDPPEKPQLSKELELFINYNKVSSQRLRNETKNE
ncbi:protein THEM6 [Ciona intestinalis]